jgi:hypothetical protein
VVRLAGLTTAGAILGFYFNDGSTFAAVGAATTLATGTTTLNTPIIGERTLKKADGSTGFSIVAPSSGIVTAEFFAAR